MLTPDPTAGRQAAKGTTVPFWNACSAPQIHATGYPASHAGSTSVFVRPVIIPQDILPQDIPQEEGLVKKRSERPWQGQSAQLCSRQDVQRGRLHPPLCAGGVAAEHPGQQQVSPAQEAEGPPGASRPGPARPPLPALSACCGFWTYVAAHRRCVAATASAWTPPRRPAAVPAHLGCQPSLARLVAPAGNGQSRRCGMTLSSSASSRTSRCPSGCGAWPGGGLAPPPGVAA